jgi:polysaccharide deacetylase 2 family uncharacterized protein YibQ
MARTAKKKPAKSRKRAQQARKKKAVPPPTGGHARLARVALGVLLTAAVIVAGLVVFTPKPDAPRSTAATVAVPKPAAPQPQAQPAPAQMPPVSPQAAPAPQVAEVPPASKPAWQRNAVPVAVTGQPMIAVVIDDMGLDRKRSQRTVDLPGPLTLAYLAYAGDLATQTGAARAAGHELLVHVPMEPGSATTDPGQNALLTALSPEELARRIAWNLSQFSGSVGINNHMGSKATADREMMGTVMEALKARGMLFLDSRTSGETVAQDVALKSGIPGLRRDVFLDHDPSPIAVRAALLDVEKVAERQGFAIAIGHPKDATINALSEWLPDVQSRGFVLVPVSAIALRTQAGG